MTVATIFGDTADGDILSANATYLTARSGGTLTATTASTTIRVGQETGFNVYETFIAFDTSVVGATSVFTAAAVLSLFFSSFGGPTVGWIIEATVSDWGTTVTTADYIAGASLPATFGASFDTTGLAASGFYLNLTENGSNIRNNVVKTGFTRFVVASSKTRAGTAPTTAEYLNLSSADTAGTSNDPKLVLTYTAAPQAPTLNSVAENATKPLVDVAWTAPGAGDAATGYKVTRATDAGFTTGVTTTDVGLVTSWQDTTTAFGTTYWYRVLGYNAGGDGANSGSLSVTTSPAPWRPPRARSVLTQAVVRKAFR